MPPRQYVGPTHSTGAPQQRAAQQLPSAPRNGMGSATNKPHVQQQSHMPANTRAPAPAPHPQPQHGMHQSRAGNNAQQEPPQHIDPPVGFYPAGAAQMLQETPALVASKVPTFNPHAESPSIRKTSGVDHSRSKPVNKDLLGALHTAAATGGGGPSAGLGQSHQHQHQQQSIPPRIGANITNPQLDTARRIGMPNSPSPMHGRPPYKPPGPATNGKRSLEGVSIPYVSYLFLPILSTPCIPPADTSSLLSNTMAIFSARFVVVPGHSIQSDHSFYFHLIPQPKTLPPPPFCFLSCFPSCFPLFLPLFLLLLLSLLLPLFLPSFSPPYSPPPAYPLVPPPSSFATRTNLSHLVPNLQTTPSSAQRHLS